MGGKTGRGRECGHDMDRMWGKSQGCEKGVVKSVGKKEVERGYRFVACLSCGGMCVQNL